jgi:hypothetical protein
VIKLLADQDFNERILRGLRRREPTLDLVRVRQLGLSAAEDAVILERAAMEDRVVLTHYRQTMSGFAYARVTAGQTMPGVFLVDKRAVGRAIDDIHVAIHCLGPEECRDVVIYFPL